MSNNDLEKELNRLIKVYGKERLLSALKRDVYDEEQEGVLTIIANAGVHHLPNELQKGETFVASRGNLDFSSEKAVVDQYESILSDLARFLKARTWKTVYLIPFGHSTLSLQIKILVFRITRIETIDMFYHSDIGYFPLKLDIRKIITES